jgi:DNA-binding NtrC family response regulator
MIFISHPKVEAFMREFLSEELKQTDDNLSEIARRLGVNRNTIARYLKYYQIPSSKQKKRKLK